MSQDLISVVIPCFNTSRFLLNCFEGLERQTYKNFEVIFVNDGSRDITLQLLEKYCQGKPNCSIINQPNLGVSTARNTGLRQAKGKYIYFCDSDDVMLPNLLEVLLKNLKDNDADLSVCNFRHISEYGTPRLKPKKHTDKKVICMDRQESMCQLFCGRFLQTSIWNKLYKKDILTQIASYPKVFSPQVCWGGDSEFNFKYLEYCTKVVYIDNQLYGYRRRSGSIVHSHFNEKMLTNFFGISNIISSCEAKYPSVLRYAKSWEGLASIATLHYIFKSNYKDKATILYLQEQAKKDIPYIVFSNKNALYFRVFAPLGYVFYKIALCGRKVKTKKSKTQISSAKNPIA